MKKRIPVFLFIILGLFMSSCSNRKGSASKIAEDKSSSQNKVIREANPVIQKSTVDTLDDYNPDERERQNIFDGVFDIPEVYVASSPASPSSIVLKDSDKIIDYDVSPAGLIVAALVSDSKNNSNLKFWDIGQKDFFEEFKFPEGVQAKSIVWHPLANAIFIIATKGDQYDILRLEREKNGWKSEIIYSTNYQLRRIVICPRPFIISYDNKQNKYIYSYRIFFGIQKEDKSFRIASITEYGKLFYQVVGPSSTFTKFTRFNESMYPSEIESNWALPISFHPSGKQLIWNDSQNNYYIADYYNSWGSSKPLLNGRFSGGSITPTPNGLGLIHWQKEKPGLGLLLLPKNEEERLATEYQFLATPSSVPDGKGIVGLTKINNKISLNYIPINIPQSDVMNAWMYSETKEDIDLFTKNYGLFRMLNNDQLYQLYESENYYCGSYDQSTPTRPYLVTTDVFWELLGSAFQGIFVIKERTQAIPAFWDFIKAANTYLKKSDNSSPWTPVFDALESLQKGETQNPETNSIMNATTEIYSEVLKKQFDYSQLKPRGFYTSSPQMQQYFKAFKYLTSAFEKDKKTIVQLNALPPDIQKYALDWIDSYKGFISSSRRPNVFDPGNISLPKYIQYPDTGLSIFPLSWGFDNEVLSSTVYRQGLPKEKQILSNDRIPRLLPSGLDLAAALSNNFANSLLEDEYKKYPPLRKVISELRENFVTNGKATRENNNLYDRWITALATQWTDTVHSINGDLDNNIWQTKRIQTGLASWATLRHATVLVNERFAAECGENGFEAILLRAPRGYVEPDPFTFGAIADIFETALIFVPKITLNNHDISNSLEGSYKSLYEGITGRLDETIKTIRMFQSIAEKERKGESITNEEYIQIMNIGRVAEHYFLIYKSLANEQYALSTPDPMPKITDVSGSPEVSYLMAAVGRPMEWNFTVPFYGRHQIVKGPIYSYFEFASNDLLNDKDWIKLSSTQSFLPWIKPYVSGQNLSYPPQSGY
jgi:hypothetical protein